MPDQSSEKDLRLAVLIDADNASRTAMKDVMAEVAVYGTPTIKRIYGDWTSPNMSTWKSILLETAITPIQQYSYTTGKNATDSAMIIDAMDILYTGQVDGFVLVSSDSDFTRLAIRLRESCSDSRLQFPLGYYAGLAFSVDTRTLDAQLPVPLAQMGVTGAGLLERYCPGGRSLALAAQAGVRYSLENPYAYVESNVLGFVNLLECCRRRPVRHLVYASSSSVYGGNGKIPFSEDDPVNDPVSLYAATKRCDELIAHVYARLYRIPSTGLRLFTVYGPWGRPDMAPMLFSRAILAGEPIRVFNNGDLSRDFTYIDDIIDAVALLLDEVPDEGVPAAVYNIGCGRPMRLMDFIHALEDALGRKAELEMLPMQKGDVHQTYADTEKLRRKIRRSPDTPLEEGIRRFAEWYRSPRNPLR